MQTVERYDASTPEDIVVTVNLAGIGSRGTAVIIDVIVQLVLIDILYMFFGLIAGLLMVGSPNAGMVIVAVLVAAAFIVLFGYHVVLEYFWRGKTLGKAAMRIHVARDGGLPLTWTAVLIRNILRLVDFLPLFYGLGLIVILCGGRRKRIGDFVAGTVVLRDDRAEPGTGYIIVAPRMYESYAYWDTTGVNDEEELLVRRFLERRPQLTSRARAALGSQLADRLRPKVLGETDGLPAEWFLENVALATSDRHSRVTWEFLQRRQAEQAGQAGRQRR